MEMTDEIPNRATRIGVSMENASPRTGMWNVWALEFCIVFM
jgi:hypothetical protein